MGSDPGLQGSVGSDLGGGRGRTRLPFFISFVGLFGGVCWRRALLEGSGLDQGFSGVCGFGPGLAGGTGSDQVARFLVFSVLLFYFYFFPSFLFFSLPSSFLF